MSHHVDPEWARIRARLGGYAAAGVPPTDERVRQAKADLAAARRRYAEERDQSIRLALDDPETLTRAAALVSAALASHRLTLTTTRDGDAA